MSSQHSITLLASVLHEKKIKIDMNNNRQRKLQKNGYDT